MKRTINISIVIAMIIAMAFTCVSCQSPPVSEVDPTAEPDPEVTIKPIALPDAVKAVFDEVAKAEANLSPKVQAAQMDFARRMLQAVNDEHTADNVVLSSQSITTALGMTYLGAKGETAEEMAKVLGIQGLDMTEVASGYKKMIAAMIESGDTTVEAANSVWVDKGYPIVPHFTTIVNDAFGADIKDIDLQSPEALPTINGWIEEKTNGMIDKLFDQAFGPADAVVLCNAIFFDGKWTMPFDPEMTIDGKFDGKPARMMNRTDDIRGKDGEGYRAVMLPYGDDERFQMVGVLPEGDINSFIKDLDAEAFTGLFDDYAIVSNAMVSMPVFKVDEKVSLKDTLRAMGMPIAFTGNADFSNMGEALCISDVLHRAKIEVDEVGTKAAAATGVVMRCTGVMEPWKFHADRPFLFFIYDSENDLVLFSAKVLEV